MAQTLETQVQTNYWPNPPAMLTVRVGDHVRHCSGSTGTVVEIYSRYIGEDEYPGGSNPIYTTVIMVQRDRAPRQRKENKPAQWDGIVEVIGQKECK